MDISFDGQYDKKTFLQALRLVQRTTRVSKGLRYLALCAALVLTITFIHIWMSGGGLAGYRLMAAVLLFAYFASPLATTWWTATRLFWKDPKRSIGGRANSLGITLLSKMAPGRYRQLPWKDFRRAGCTDALVGLLVKDGTLWVFQRVFFASEGDWNKFMQLVKKNIIETK